MLKRSVKNLSVLACAVEGGLLGSNAHRTGINGLVVNGSENSSIFLIGATKPQIGTLRC